MLLLVDVYSHWLFLKIIAICVAMPCGYCEAAHLSYNYIM